MAQNMLRSAHHIVGRQGGQLDKYHQLMCCAGVQKITGGALVMEIAAVVILGATVIAFDYLNSRDLYYY